MSRIKELEQLIQDKEKELDPLKKELRKLYEKEQEECAEKINRCYNRTDKFTLEELRYSRTSRCGCGAGMAYPLTTSPRGDWHCGAILTGTAEAGTEHSPALPFMMYEVKSENETQTTRPQS